MWATAYFVVAVVFLLSFEGCFWSFYADWTGILPYCCYNFVLALNISTARLDKFRRTISLYNKTTIDINLTKTSEASTWPGEVKSRLVASRATISRTYKNISDIAYIIEVLYLIAIRRKLDWLSKSYLRGRTIRSFASSWR